MMEELLFLEQCVRSPRRGGQSQSQLPRHYPGDLPFKLAGEI
jgi:hypothetical protein